MAGRTSTVLRRAVIPTRRKHQVVNSETLCSPNRSPPGSLVLGGCWGQSSGPHTREALYSGLRFQPQLSVCEAGKAKQRASPLLLFTVADRGQPDTCAHREQHGQGEAVWKWHRSQSAGARPTCRCSADEKPRAGNKDRCYRELLKWKTDRSLLKFVHKKS